MQGLILSYRRGRHTQDVNQMIVEIENIDNKIKAKELLGKELLWVSLGGKKIKGKVISLHGNKGIVRAKFEKNLPGQSIGTKVQLL